MTQQMERNIQTALLVLLAVLQVLSVRTPDCPDQPDQNLTCYTDYNHHITCVWNSAYEHREARCTLNAERVQCKPHRVYNASCDLEPAHVSGPGLRKCTLDFKRDARKFSRFQSDHILSINLECAPAKQILTIFFKPACHIKLNPPGEPGINGTTASWISEVEEHPRINDNDILYTSQLQWKRWDQSWSDPSVQTKQTKQTNCKRDCTAELLEETLALGEKHEARARVKSTVKSDVSTWSDWSPSASWVSPVGIARPPSRLTGAILAVIIGGAALASILAVILFRTEKASWVYEKMRGPDPGKSFLKDVDFQNWLSPHLANESFLSSRKVEDISSVEVVSSVEPATLCSKEVALLVKMRSESNCQLTSSIFLNPSYSHLCSPPPFPLPSACDAPHGTRHSLGDGRNAEQVREEERMKELEMLRLLSKGNSSSEPLPVVSDYEKVEKLQVECSRLQRLDSGMCSGEEVSQESLEADNISANESPDKAPEERKGGIGPVDFQKLFGGSGSVFGKRSIQVCSDYEQVQRLQPESPELPSLDSGVSSGGEEQGSHDDSLEDEDKSSESTHFLFPPPLASSALPRSGISFPQQFSGLSSSPSLRPSGDGYMPAKQEPC